CMHVTKLLRFRRKSCARFVLPIFLAGSLATAEPSAAKAPIAPRFVDGLKEQTARVALLRDGTLIAIFLRNTQAGPELVARYSHDNGHVWGDIQGLCFLPKDDMGWGSPEPLVDQDGELHLFYLKGRKNNPSIDI